MEEVVDWDVSSFFDFYLRFRESNANDRPDSHVKHQ